MRNNRKDQFEYILESFDNIPDCRKYVNEQNLLWFLRSGAAMNHKHKNYEKAVSLAQDLLKTI